ncbi:hypothetical protein ACFW1A_13410 [Kitasatospora sp. NPDC058965]|uniref:hypothetical protein n=1 Tax=Kitasatospora sp. NPDC058965 TaxID=3346682 RepID=UPI0036826FF4
MAERAGAAKNGRRIDLSMAQVVASALAAVVGAVLASELGVYGTIIGAAVVSVGATVGSAVFHHAFKRTGEQLREAVGAGPGQTVNELRQAPAAATAPLPAAWRPDRAAPAGAGPDGAPADGGWHASPVQRAGRRWGWRGYAVASALVFVLAMAPIVVVELASGRNMHAITTGEQGGGTSILPGRTDRSDPAPGPTPAPKPAGSASGDPSTAPVPPVTSPSTGTTTPAPTGSPGAGPSPSPSPSTSPGASADASPGPGASTPVPQPPAPPTGNDRSAPASP